MGAKNSKLSSPGGGNGQQQQTSDSHSSSSPRPTPHIEAPYGGPWAEYQFVDVKVPIETDATYSFADGALTSTKCSSVLPQLQKVYAQGYGLATFCRVPCGGGSQRRVFTQNKEVMYQGVFCRYEGDPGNDGWDLRVEKSLLHPHHVTPGVVTTEAGPGAQHVQQLISSTVQAGGRLLAVQWSGQPHNSPATESAVCVDVFFEVPLQPLPERSVYQLVTAPAALVKRSLFQSRCHLTCDWAGILTRHLARGWRLVDVFCELPPAQGFSTSLSPAHVKVQTVWFFEKPESRARDESAVYEGNIVEQWTDGTASTSLLVLPGGAGGCLGGRSSAAATSSSSSSSKNSGGGSVSSKKSGLGKKNPKKLASFRKKSPDDPAHDVKNGEPAERVESAASAGGSKSQEEDHPWSREKGDGGGGSETQPESAGVPETAGWEATIQSMGEKGWELACIINTMDSQVVSGKHKVKVLLAFQRKLSLTLTVKGRRNSDGLQLRADTGASTTVMCDLPMMTGETTSHLNPSLAVRLPLSRSASREHDDFPAAGCYDDVPSTIGGAGGGGGLASALGGSSYLDLGSRTQSASDVNVGAGGGGFLDPHRGARGERWEGLHPGKGGGAGSTACCREGGGGGMGGHCPGAEGGGDLGSGRSSSPPSGSGSQHSKVTAAEVHTSCDSGGSDVTPTPGVLLEAEVAPTVAAESQAQASTIQEDRGGRPPHCAPEGNTNPDFLVDPSDCGSAAESSATNIKEVTVRPLSSAQSQPLASADICSQEDEANVNVIAEGLLLIELGSRTNKDCCRNTEAPLRTEVPALVPKSNENLQEDIFREDSSTSPSETTYPGSLAAQCVDKLEPLEANIYICHDVKTDSPDPVTPVVIVPP